MNENPVIEHPTNETMGALVGVAFPKLGSRTSEEAWEQDIVNVAGAAAYADKTLDTLEVRALAYKDCE